MDEVIKKLRERAASYEEPFAGNRVAFVQSPNWAVAQALIEVAIALKSIDARIQK